MKKLICLLMAAVMLFASAVCAFADSAPEQEQAAADRSVAACYFILISKSDS